MPCDVIICDDSSFARKQLIHILPKSLVLHLYQASNGEEAMDLIRSGNGQLLFLDLTMPVMDGYQVLDALKKENLNIPTIVLSADIQEKAQQKILSYKNVLSFLQKPLDSEKLIQVLISADLCSNNDDETISISSDAVQEESNMLTDILKERINIAAGSTASRMGSMINLFITMPMPRITTFIGNDVALDISTWLNVSDEHNEHVNIVISQGFTGSCLAGEVLLYFSKKDIYNFSSVFGDPTTDFNSKKGMCIELSGLMGSTLVNNLAGQLATMVYVNHPSLVPQIMNIQNDDTKKNNAILNYNLSSPELKDKKILGASLLFRIKDLDMSIKCILLLTQKSAENLKKIMAFV